MFDLTGKSALVTGASGGIGGAIARQLHGQGATVALSGTRTGPLEALAAELGERAHVCPCDLSDAAALAELPKQAAEVGSRGITVNCIAPGFIATAMTDKLNDDQKAKLLGAIPARRMGTADEIASAAVYLASDEAAYVTGQTIHVNGGMAMI